MKKPFLYILFTFILLASFTAKAQKFSTKKADEYFARTYYAKAIPLYEEAINRKSPAASVRNLADTYCSFLSVLISLPKFLGAEKFSVFTP